MNIKEFSTKVQYYFIMAVDPKVFNVFLLRAVRGLILEILNSFKQPNSGNSHVKFKKNLQINEIQILFYLIFTW
jgi:hypothetical protein